MLSKYENNGIYFTGAQCQILIGDRVISEVNQLTGSMNVDKIPVYGYASQLFNTMVTGRVIATGSFTINYVFDGYLLSFINQDKTDKSKAKANNITKNNGNATFETNDSYYKDIISDGSPKSEFIITNQEIEDYKKQYWDTGNHTQQLIRPEFTSPFTIKIRDFRIGSLVPNEEFESTYEEKILTHVHITQSGTARVTDGSNVVEQYSFYSRQII